MCIGQCTTVSMRVCKAVKMCTVSRLGSDDVVSKNEEFVSLIEMMRSWRLACLGYGEQIACTQAQTNMSALERDSGMTCIDLANYCLDFV
jgi:hypothetical protein